MNNSDIMYVVGIAGFAATIGLLIRSSQRPPVLRDDTGMQ